MTNKNTVVVLVGSTGPMMSSVKVAKPSPSDTDIPVESTWKPTATKILMSIVIWKNA